MKNWKSTTAFFVFVGAYIYTIYMKSSDAVVDTAGYVALLSSLFMMLRSEVTADMLNKMIDKIKV